MTAKKRPPDRGRAAAVSDHLRAVITARGDTPSSVARAADVAPSVLTRFMNGERGLTLDTFDRITTALGLRLVETGRRGKVGPRREKNPAAAEAAADSEP